MNIILLGSPGAGKDTFANAFLQKFNFTMISTGEMFRSEAESKSELGLKAKEYWSIGKLCPDDITNKLIAKKIKELKGHNLIFNGFPRSLEQAKYLSSLVTIDLVIDLAVTEDIAVERLVNRGREDDKLDIIRRRFKEYIINTEPLSLYYMNSEDSTYAVIDADAPPHDIYEEAVGYILEFA